MRGFPLGHGPRAATTPSIATRFILAHAVTELRDDRGRTGVGFAFTLGEGNQLVCEAARFYAQQLIGKPIEEIMALIYVAPFNVHSLTDEQQFRWLGPHKGVVHLALASVTNACWDLWAKNARSAAVKLLLNLTPEQVVATLDLSYLEDMNW